MTEQPAQSQHVPCPDCGTPSVLHWTPAGWKCRACRSAYRERALDENERASQRGDGQQANLFGDQEDNL